MEKNQLPSLTDNIHSLTNDIRNRARAQNLNYIILGMELEYIQKNKLYLNYADHIKDFEGFLLELSDIYSSSAWWQIIRVFRRFKKYLLKGIDKGEIPTMRRLFNVLPIAKTEKEIEEWYHKALTLPAKDYNKEVKEKRGGKVEENCSHPVKYLLVRCRDCGKVFLYKPISDKTLEILQRSLK